ncbi:thioredoxin family protein [Marinigracilibium pacificum]|uniref:Thioredoxin family protein n=1 Tax=Marinigracilibium pacificum TaxID=2729599 RepID=A0A848J6S4_9BACT|nr:thioredoxin family protein [Marinigracilibium pacificum]NMM50089.1 thioredoxin family protein [Marinigracilibium pacificum]
MALTPTKNIPLGFNAPDFELQDTITGKTFSLNDLRGSKATVVAFICNHCPYVIHIREKLVEIADKYEVEGINFIAINSNDIEKYPEDSPEKMKELATALNFPFPYLFDESQEVAKKYDAACTPDFSVFDENLLCIYRGRFDESRPGNDIPVTGDDLSEVLEAVLSGDDVSQEQLPSMGCNIKWKPGNEPK